MTLKLQTGILGMVLLALPVWGETDLEVRLPPREDFHLFLLAGQSNMTGRGIVGAEDHLTCKSDNIHFDTRSLHEFGRRYAEAYQAVFSLSTCGVGPTLYPANTNGDSHKQRLKGER